jgi:hypothetical protein
MKYIIFSIMMLITINAMSATTELTMEQQKQIQSIIQQTQQKTIEPEDIEKWANLGSKIGVGLASTAKELGVAATEFATTTTGRIVTFVILWQFLGNAIVHIITGLTMWFFGIPLIWYVMSKSVHVDSEYNTNKTNIFGNHPLQNQTRHSMDGDQMIVAMVISVVVGFAGMVVLLNA